MNKQRRAALGRLQNRLQSLSLPLAGIFEELRSVARELEALRDEEQDALDGLPESLRDDDRGQDMQYAIEALEEACELLEALVDLDDSVNEAYARIEDAKGLA